MQWAKNFGSISNSQTPSSISLDASYNPVIVGNFTGIVDFDMGPSTYTMWASNGAAFTLKIDAAGNFNWAKQMGKGGGISVSQVTIGPFGDIYTVGNYANAADMDLGPATYTIPSVGFSDMWLHKLDSTGLFKWVIGIGGPTNDHIRSVAVDVIDNVYITSFFDGTIDFNPSSGTVTLSASGTDAFVEKFCQTPASPVAILGNTVVCSGQVTTYSIAPVQNTTSYNWIFPSGWAGSSSTTTVNVSPGLASGVVTVAAVNACGFGYQMLGVTVNPSPTITVNSGSICTGDSFTFSPSGAASYSITGNNFIVSPLSTTSFSLTGTNTIGCVSAQVVATVTVNIIPVISVSSGSICIGQNFTITPTGANTYTFSSGSAIVSPTVNTTYSVSGTSIEGCISSSIAIVSVSVNFLPVITSSTSNTLICAGQSVTLTANGGLTYSWNPGGAGASIVISPTATINYTVTGTDSNGCSNSDTLTQFVSACVGIDQVGSSLGQTSIYPNPANNIIYIEQINNREVLFYGLTDITGKELIRKRQIISIKEIVDVSEYAKGIYFLQISTANGQCIVKKIVKE